MSSNPITPFEKKVLEEIWEDMASLKGEALDHYLASLVLDPAELVLHYDKSVCAAELSLKRVQFEEARQRVHSETRQRPFNIVSFDFSRKQKVLATIKERAVRTNDMTIAARNQEINAEEDMDAYLEACILLGLIDEDGNLVS